MAVAYANGEPFSLPADDLLAVALSSVEAGAATLSAVHTLFEAIGGDDPLFEGEDALADPTYNLHDALISLSHLRRKLRRRLELENDADNDAV